jgi:very-short-patch-repair endonuclease
MIARLPLPPHLVHSPFTYREGLTAGLGEGRLRGADLHRPYRGVRVATEPTRLEQRARAFQRRAPDNTYLCSVTAALLYRIPLSLRLEQSLILHVGVPAPTRAPRVKGVVGHKFQIEESDIRDWYGLKVTTPERTWCDLATVLSVPDLVAAGDYVIHWELPLASREALNLAMLRHPGQRGHRRLVRAFSQLDDRSESRQESLLRVIVLNARIRGVETNLWLTTSGGFHYRGDLVVREKKVIIEYQSRFHDGTKEFAADMTRISRLEADGWYILQVNNHDLDDPAELVQRIRKVLDGGARHPARGQ